ncbi:MAG: DUF58 domain-containing protein [Gammaproteobacteria bacterium]|nr:DUF58 domain-containing protein [Gammaproteobacteria bacterium]
MPVFHAIKKLFDSVGGLSAPTVDALQRPLLSTQEIGELMAKAGRMKATPLLSSNRFAGAGEQPSTLLGSGLDFAGRRTYVAGDDPRNIDWRASARSQQTLLRNHYSELNSPACVVIDRRPAMAFGTRKRLKVTQALRVGITLGMQMLRGGHHLACLLLDHPDYWQAPVNSPAQFRQTIEKAAAACYPDDRKPLVRWNRISENIKRNLALGSQLVIISDFLPLNEVELKALRQLSQLYALTLIQILDRSELELPTVSQITLNYRKKNQQLLDSPLRVEQLNRILASQWQRQHSQFKKIPCRFIRLYADDELDAVRVPF